MWDFSAAFNKFIGSCSENRGEKLYSSSVFLVFQFRVSVKKTHKQQISLDSKLGFSIDGVTSGEERDWAMFPPFDLGSVRSFNCDDDDGRARETCLLLSALRIEVASPSSLARLLLSLPLLRFCLTSFRIFKAYREKGEKWRITKTKQKASEFFVCWCSSTKHKATT